MKWMSSPILHSVEQFGLVTEKDEWALESFGRACFEHLSNDLHPEEDKLLRNQSGLHVIKFVISRVTFRAVLDEGFPT